MIDLLARRLRTQYLCGAVLPGPAEVVGWFGAMQAQEYAAAKWSVAQRAAGVDAAAMQRAVDEGVLLRTHALRPTWHFVRPDDLVWIQRLTAPRVNALSAYYYRQIGADEDLFRRSNRLITRALAGGNHLTRKELQAVLAAGGIEAAGIRLAYLVMRAELDALICSGVMRGKQHTYALVVERAPDAVELAPDAALAELTRRYFTSHGPATVKDFTWWSSLTVAQARAGLGLVGAELVREEIDGQVHWSSATAPAPGPGAPALLLQAYDEYLVAYREGKQRLDRAGVIRAAVDDDQRFAHAVVLDGQVVGTWRPGAGRAAATVDATVRVPVDDADRTALAVEAERYGRYLGQPVHLSIHEPA